MKSIEIELQNKLRIPVVSMDSGEIVILNKIASDAEVLNSQEALNLLESSCENNSKKSEESKKVHLKIARLKQVRRNSGATNTTARIKLKKTGS